MYWFRIEKESAIQPAKGTYTDWKPILANESKNRCVYCSIHEAQFGGVRNYHVEHYKPKSRDEFKALENDITNLFYACCICNCFKGSAWPADPVNDHSISAFPNPSVHDYSAILDVDDQTGELDSKYVAGIYLINKLYLNRPQLLLERRIDFTFSKLADLRKYYDDSIDRLEKINDDDSMKLLVDIARTLSKIDKLKDMIRVVRPYVKRDITR